MHIVGIDLGTTHCAVASVDPSKGPTAPVEDFPVPQLVRQGEVSRVDGPYAEAKEAVGGWALLEYDTVEEAVADQEQFAELHAKHWPEVTVIATLRQISTGPEAPGA